MRDPILWLAVFFEVIAAIATLLHSRFLAAAGADRRMLVASAAGCACFLSLGSSILLASSVSMLFGLTLFALCLAGVVASYWLGGIPFPGKLNRQTVETLRNRREEP